MLPQLPRPGYAPEIMNKNNLGGRCNDPALEGPVLPLPDIPKYVLSNHKTT